jgi:hypothetical protein
MGNQNIFLEENLNPPWKLNGPSLIKITMVKVQYGDWLIGYCLAPSEHYFSFIQDYVEMREGLGLLGKQFLTVNDKVWRVGQGRKI